MHAAAESRDELNPFGQCYKKAVKDHVERRRQADQPVPEELNEEPSAELD